jgi:hypothetical protein
MTELIKERQREQRREYKKSHRVEINKKTRERYAKNTERFREYQIRMFG